MFCGIIFHFFPNKSRKNMNVYYREHQAKKHQSYMFKAWKKWKLLSCLMCIAIALYNPKLSLGDLQYVLKCRVI